MVDRIRMASVRGRRRAWLASIAFNLDEAALLVAELRRHGMAPPALGAEIAAARNMVNALSAANAL